VATTRAAERADRRGRRSAAVVRRAGSGPKLGVVGLDAVVVAAVVVAAAVASGGAGDPVVAPLAVVATLAMLWRARLYSVRFFTRRSDELRRIVGATWRSVALVVLGSFVVGLDVSRAWMALTAAGLIVGLGVTRELVRRHFDRQRRDGRLRRRVVIVGANAEALLLADMFAEEPELGYEVVATIEPPVGVSGRTLTTAVLHAVRENRASGAVVAASALEVQVSNRLVRDLTEAGLHVEVSATLTDIAPDRLTVRPLGRFPVVYVEPVRRGGWRGFAKRGFDLVVSLLALVVLAPVVAVIAAAIRLDSAGPVLFRQTRVGKDGERFEVFKFRTMVANAEELLSDLRHLDEGAGPLFKMRRDPRVTSVGRFLRRTSLDELPQLLNVVRGDMSLVGPRPALASEMREWGEDLYGRLRVKPGITGMWQVSGRSGTTFEEYTRLDLYYVDNWSLLVDLSILARTVPAVLRSDGAY
jgi:exopolysaccharide biosynthesis polyprenyl glycosylphosphotransferase